MEIYIQSVQLYEKNVSVELADKNDDLEYQVYVGRENGTFYKLDPSNDMYLPDVLTSTDDDIELFGVAKDTYGYVEMFEGSVCVETIAYNSETGEYEDITMPAGYSITPWTGTSYTWSEFETLRGSLEDSYAEYNRIASYDEAVDCAINERKKYITTVDDGGIKVHADGDETSYLKIDNDSVDVYVDETLATTFGLTKIYNDSIATPTPVLKDVRPSMVGNGKLFITNNAMSEHPASFVYLNDNTVRIGSYHSAYFAPGTEPSGTRYNFTGIEATSGENNLTELNLYGSVKVNGDALNGRESAKSEWFTANGNATITNRCTYNPIINAFIVNLVVVLPNATAGAWQKVGTVAEGYRPPYAMALSAAHNIATSNANTHGVYAFINTSGEVYVKRTTSASSSFTTYVTGMYFV